MKFDSKEYLPDSEKRLEHLRRIINGRPVAILVAGPSIYELEQRINELSHADICYFGMNNFFVQENHILKKINKHFSLLVEAPDNTGKGFSFVFNRVVDFLDRNDDNMLISFFDQFDMLLGPDFNLQKFWDKYDKKLFSIYYTSLADRIVPNNDRPLHFIIGNSLSWLIYLAVIGKASKIVLFGADGYTINKDVNKTFYRPEEYGTDPQKQLMENTNKGFNPIVNLCLRNIYKTHHIEPVPILNCSEVSFLTPFPKVSYNDGLAFLLDKKNAKEISDLRIPTASIIIPSDGNETKLRDTLKNIAEQSYSNYETIVIKRSSNFLDTMRNALSLARGKYIFYCPAGNDYQDQNWINSCLEVLENRPQISLICATPEDRLTDSPWPKKTFIYYWLKKKIFFPPNTLCVRKQVLEKCLFRADNTPTTTEFESWLNFNLYFNIDGYLPVFIPIAAAPYQYPNKAESLNAYRRQINNYKNRLIFKKTSHHFRDGGGNTLSGKFYLSVFLFYGLIKGFGNKPFHFLNPGLNAVKQMVRKCYPK